MNLSPLIYEDDNISLGRVAFWVSFSISFYYWAILFKDTPSSLTTTMGTLLLYNIAKKGIDTIAPK